MSMKVSQREKRQLSEWELVEKIMKQRPLGDAWGRIVQNLSLEFVETNREALSTRFAEELEREALAVYDGPMVITQVYGFNEQLLEKLKREAEEMKGVEVKADEAYDHRTRRNFQVIRMITTTTLREFCRDYRLPHQEGDTIGVGQVRFMIYRQFKYLLSLPNVTEVKFAGRVFEMTKIHRQFVSPGKTAQQTLPYQYPSILEAKLRRKRFRRDHPELNCFQDVVYDLYQLVGDNVFKAIERGVAYQKQKAEELDAQERQRHEENQNRGGFRIQIPRNNWSSRNHLHDYLYRFEGCTNILTAGAARKLLALHPVKTQDFLEVVRDLNHLLDSHDPDPLQSAWGRQRRLKREDGMPLKEKRKLYRSFLNAADPVKAIRDYATKLMHERDEQQVQLLKVKESVLNIFFDRMRKYAPRASVATMIRLFGAKDASKMIRGKYEGLFEPETIAMPLQWLGNQIREALGSGGQQAGVKNPKRLFHKLSKIGDVKSMTNGIISDPLAALLALREMGWTVSSLDEQVLALRAEIEPKCSPEFLVAGDASVCCMSFGASNAQEYAKHKGFGVLNVYLGDRIIANSVLWLNQLPTGDKALVLDNIEVAPNYVRFNPYLKDLFTTAAEHLMQKYGAVMAVQGARYNDLSLDKVEHPLNKMLWQIKAVDVPTSFSSDAENVHVVASTQCDEIAAQWKEQMLKLERERIAAGVSGRISHELVPEFFADEDPFEGHVFQPIQPGPLHLAG